MDIRRRNSRLAFAASAALLLSACGTDDSGIVIETIGGVPTVQNPARGVVADSLPWRVEQYLLVAGDQLYERKPATFALDVGILPNGNVVVLDTGNRRVLRFRPDGAYIGFFGGAGQEPGQFVTPLFLEVAGERIYVLDTSLNRVTAFDTSGTFLQRFQVDLRGLAATTPLFAASAADEIFIAAEPVPFLQGARDTGDAVIYRYDRAGAITDTLARLPAPNWTRIELPEDVSFVKPRLAPDPKISAKPGLVALAVGSRYEFQVRRADGSLLRRVSRAYQNVAVTPAIRDSVINLLVRTRPDVPREALDEIPFAPVVPAIRGLVLDDRGRVWVDPYGSETTRRDIFDADGRYVGAVYLPQPAFLEDVRGDRACGVLGDGSGPSAAVCYQIEESG